ncbi:hypothetical protein LJC60_00430 [Ruminococcaceae bacterium OttesenSCG-928-D13]|nr:hypothetical protein [Ruminococcaceae bacterium OttesenSCG-928-D13]
MLAKMPGQAARVIQTIHAAGGRAYLVGGALRDLALGGTPKDWDFATTLSPQKLLALLPGARLIGGGCGTVQAHFVDSCLKPYSDWTYEITPCRTESGYSDRRHPDVVEFVPDILADLARRDFTVNAMAWDGQVLFDPFGGQRDLRLRLLRCVGNPADRFNEDPLRVLRLFRLAAQLGFTAEWETFCAAGEAMELIATLPKDRVAAEVRNILFSDGPQVLSGVIVKGGLHGYGFDFAPALNALREVPSLPLCRWWGLIALCGADIENVCRAFGFSRRFQADLENCTRLYRQGPALDNTSLKQKLAGSKLDYAPIAATFAAVSPAFAAEPALFASVCARHEPYRREDLAVNGDMLAAEGIQGRHCGKVLDALLAAVIQNPALNKAEVLLGLARGLKKTL